MTALPEEMDDDLGIVTAPTEAAVSDAIRVVAPR
jgi:hypothetical protein